MLEPVVNPISSLIISKVAQPLQTDNSALSEIALWETLCAFPDLASRQAATRWSLTLGAHHSYEARSMMAAIFQVLQPGRIVETGTYHGLTSAFMWKLGEHIGKVPQINTFDIAESSLAAGIWSALGASDDIRFNKGDSGALISNVCPKDQEFVLIDGDHSYAGAERDWSAVKPKLSSRCVVLFDNMSHGAGCGRFFSTLEPLWFHPEMSFLAMGLSAEELSHIFTFYTQRLMPVWLDAIASKRGDELQGMLESYLRMLDQPGPRVDSYQEIADLGRKLSAVAADSEFPPESFLIETSARYGIGDVSQARRQRAREALPTWLQPMANRIYRAIKQIG
ncbi:MAG TPA: class I SAM-dependent methyltransferase [Pyrinomonadaceae bacterium]|nr:class I SAM-dependent methyltransferase [Pyrinomonadaceae bacterium]